MKRNNRTKELILDQIRKVPIIELACQKAEVSRMTLLRWKKDDPKFAKDIDEAMNMGKSLISDVAEANLINAIKQGNMRGIIFWLTHQKDEYRNKIELSGSMTHIREELTDDEVEILRQALELAGYEENISKKSGDQKT
jgi:predicted DNA binding protein